MTITVVLGIQQLIIDWKESVAVSVMDVYVTSLRHITNRISNVY